MSETQDQGSLDEPQQQVEAQPDANAGNAVSGAYQTPGVVPPEAQASTTVPTPSEGEAVLPDGSIVPASEATPEAIQAAQNNPSAAAPAPGGGAAAGGGDGTVAEEG